MSRSVAFVLVFAGLASSGSAGQSGTAAQATARPVVVQPLRTPAAAPAPTSQPVPIPAGPASAPPPRPVSGGSTAPAISADAADVARNDRRPSAPVPPMPTERPKNISGGRGGA